MGKKRKNKTLGILIVVLLAGAILVSVNLQPSKYELVEGYYRFGNWEKYNGTHWFGGENCFDGCLISVTDEFICRKVVASVASGPGQFVIYARKSDSTFEKIGETELITPTTSWEWTEFPVKGDGIPMHAGMLYFVGALFKPDAEYFGINAKEAEPIGDDKKTVRFGGGYDDGPYRVNMAPDTLPALWNLEFGLWFSLYVTGEPYTPPPEPPATPYIIPSLASGQKYCMRGYGGFPDTWDTSSYKIVRVQFYSLLASDGTLIPHADSGEVGSENGGTWEAVEEAIANIKSWGGIPNLCIWIDNVDQTIDGYDPPTQETWEAFFLKLKNIMATYGVSEMLFEPPWEFNSHGPVSPSHMRDCYIEPTAYQDMMINIRRARDNVGISCSIISHMLGLHGDSWYEPDRETWKRTYMLPWFSGMSWADIITISLYLSDSFGFNATNWRDYLSAVYSKVVGLQKAENGWAPAVYMGTSEHNLNYGELKVSETLAMTGEEVYDKDFQWADATGLQIFGWWLPFSDSETTEYVNNLAYQYQSGTLEPLPDSEQPPTENPPQPTPSPSPLPPLPSVEDMLEDDTMLYIAAIGILLLVIVVWRRKRVVIQA